MVRETHRDDARASIADTFTVALTAADLLLRNGASSAAATRSMLGIARAAGYDEVTANVTLGQITLSYFPDDGTMPATRIQNVGPSELDLRTMRAVEQLVESIVVGDCSIAEGIDQLAELDADDRSPRSLRMLGALMMAVGFAWLLGGGWQAALVAAGCAVLTEAINDASTAIELPSYYARVLSSAIAVTAAAAIVAATSFGQPGVIIVASLVTQLAGGTSVSAIQDLLTGWLLTACGRLIEAAIMTVGLVVGAVGAVVAAHRFGIGLKLADIGASTPPLAVSALAAGVIAFGFSIYCQVERWALLVLPLLGACGHVAEAVFESFDISTITATSLAAMLIGALSVLLARPMGWPTSGALDIAVTPLLPGMALYEGLAKVVTHDHSASSSLFQAVGVALAIGTGAVFGQFAAGKALWGARRGQMHLRERRSGEVLERRQFEASDLVTPDFRRPFTSHDG